MFEYIEIIILTKINHNYNFPSKELNLYQSG